MPSFAQLTCRLTCCVGACYPLDDRSVIDHVPLISKEARTMDAKTLFNQKLPEVFEKSPDQAKELGCIYLFKITGDGGGTWTVDCKSATPSVAEGEQGEADCAIELTDEDFETMTSDPQMAMQLFFQGKIRITGDPMLATKLGNLLGMGSGG